VSGGTPRGEEDDLTTESIPGITDISILKRKLRELQGEEGQRGRGGALTRAPPNPIDEEMTRLIQERIRVLQAQPQPQPQVGGLPELPYDPDFFESQENLGCGRHALNNLFGGKYFIATQEPAYTLEEIKAAGINLSTQAPLDLQRLCKYLHSIGLFTPGENLETSCPPHENYDVTVLIAALQVCGFHVNDFSDPTKKTLEDDDTVLGYIINKGDLAFNQLTKEVQDEINKTIEDTWKLISETAEFKSLTHEEKEKYQIEYLEYSTKPPKIKHYVSARRIALDNYKYRDSLKPKDTPIGDIKNKDLRIGTVKKRTVQQLDLINTQLEIQSGSTVTRNDPDLEAAVKASLEHVQPAAPQPATSQPAETPPGEQEAMTVIREITTDPRFGTQLVQKYLGQTYSAEDKQAFIELLKIITLIKSKGLNIPIDEPSNGEKVHSVTPFWQAIILDQNVIDLMKPTHPINPKLRTIKSQFEGIDKLPEQAYRLGFTGLDFKDTNTKLGFLYQFLLKPDGQLDKEFIKALIGDKTPTNGIQSIKALLAHVLGKITGATLGVNFLLGTSIGATKGGTRRKSKKRAKKGLSSRKRRGS
jgi:hypothetical protein